MSTTVYPSSKDREAARLRREINEALVRIKEETRSPLNNNDGKQQLQNGDNKDSAFGSSTVVRK